MSGYRLDTGGLIDKATPLEFTFDGRRLTGYAGDTLASALIANGISVVARSFKYHRRRGIVSCGSEEPNGLVTLGEADRTEPNCKATMVELYEGLVARSQNRWPTLEFDLMAITQLAKPFLAAGFYYKMFMGPHRGAWKWYEPFIRRAAGMGAGTERADPDAYESVNAFADVVIVGGGPTGMIAALVAGRAGARTLLLDESPELGGDLLTDSCRIGGAPAREWIRSTTAELAGLSNVSVLKRTTAYGCYDDKLVTAAERVSDHLPPNSHRLPRQRHWKIRARQVVLAAGAVERPAVFDRNDLPGVMLARSVASYATRFAVAPGRRIVFFVNNDGAYQSIATLDAAGVRTACIVDTRPSVGRVLAALAEQAGAEHLCGWQVVRANGRRRLKSIEVARPGSSSSRRIAADCLAVSAGWTPTVNLATQAGSGLVWDPRISAFLPEQPEGGYQAGGSMCGRYDTASCLSDGARMGASAVEALGLAAPFPPLPPVGNEWAAGEIFPFRDVASGGSNAFVDLQHDVTAGDIRLAFREGFRSPEHIKRYTTLGMATDQGKTSNHAGLALLASLSGRPMREIAPTGFRPPYTPVSIGALAGNARGQFFRPVRRTPVHDWHIANGARMNPVGQWLRPFAYPHGKETLSQATAREARRVREGVGIVDVSTLGKIDVQGPDSAEFLDRVYVNNWLSLPVGKARYGLMLREDGIVLDDGTTWRLAEHRYLMTTTTANAARVLTHLEYLLAVAWPGLRVTVTSVTEQWAAFALSGPASRGLLQQVARGPDLSNDALPVMHICSGEIAGVPVMICRLSFSGELAYEVYTGSSYGLRVWEHLTEVGREQDIVPYGTDALGTLRIEKGHVSGPEIDGRTTAGDLGLGGPVSRKKESFVGSAMLNREALVDPDRLQLVGLLSPGGEPIRAGSQIVEKGSRPSESLGHVTSPAYSPALDRYIALSLVRSGRRRIGERLVAAYPLKDISVPVEVVEPCFYDKSGSRMHA